MFGRLKLFADLDWLLVVELCLPDKGCQVLRYAYSSPVTTNKQSTINKIQRFLYMTSPPLTVKGNKPIVSLKLSHKLFHAIKTAPSLRTTIPQTQDSRESSTFICSLNICQNARNRTSSGRTVRKPDRRQGMVYLHHKYV